MKIHVCPVHTLKVTAVSGLSEARKTGLKLLNILRRAVVSGMPAGANLDHPAHFSEALIDLSLRQDLTPHLNQGFHIAPLTTGQHESAPPVYDFEHASISECANNLTHGRA